jgi:hypothetical protein
MTIELLYSGLRSIVKPSHIKCFNVIIQLGSYLAIKQYIQRFRT